MRMGLFSNSSLKNTISSNADSIITKNENSWPPWTYSRLFPDYFTVQGTALIFSFGTTVDDYSNIYVSFGGSLGLELALFGLSGRATGGWIIADQTASNNSMGVDWSLQSNSPTEQELETFLQGWSAGGGIGGGPPQTAFVGPGMDGIVTINDPSSAGIEVGAYTPQAGGGVSYSWLIYDAGSSTPWFWQRWWQWGIE